MATIATTLRPDELSLFLDNRVPLTTGQVVCLLTLVEDLARDAWGNSLQAVEVSELKTGSLTAIFRILTSPEAGAAASVGAFALALSTAFGPNNRTDAISKLINDAEVREIVIRTNDQVIRIEKENLIKPKSRGRFYEKGRRLNPDGPLKGGDSEWIAEGTPHETKTIIMWGVLSESPLTFRDRAGRSYRVKLDLRRAPPLVFDEEVGIVATLGTDEQGPFLLVTRVKPANNAGP